MTEKEEKQVSMHKDFFDRCNLAIGNGFYLEAILMEYAAIESRLEALCGVIGFRCGKACPNRRDIKISTRIECLRKYVNRNASLFAKSKLPPNFFTEKGRLRNWIEDRDRIVHGLYKNEIEYTSRISGSKELAEKGIKYARLLYNETHRFRRLSKSHPDLMRGAITHCDYYNICNGKRESFEFGKYIQRKNGSPEPIEWIILEKKGNRALVTSKYALDQQQYNTSDTEVTWETCSLRKWLNGTFLSTAFSSEEQNSIISCTVTADKNPSYSTSPGNNTTDKVFLLSITEANKYFKSDKARKCALTDYAIAQNVPLDYLWTHARPNQPWWLRSPGKKSNYAAYVHTDGHVFDSGCYVDGDGFAVRPALWIDLGS